MRKEDSVFVGCEDFYAPVGCQTIFPLLIHDGTDAAGKISYVKWNSPFQMIKSFGLSYRTAGENIAFGQRTPQAVVTTWMNSSDHRASILNAAYTQIGVGYAPNGHYWTQLFIG